MPLALEVPMPLALGVPMPLVPWVLALACTYPHTDTQIHIQFKKVTSLKDWNQKKKKNVSQVGSNGKFVNVYTKGLVSFWIGFVMMLRYGYYHGNYM